MMISSEYYLALFDVLGFKRKFNNLGLPKIAAIYELLIEAVNKHNEHIDRVFGILGFSESAYWAAGGEIVIFNKVYGAYSSDTILVWSHSLWPEARDKTADQRNKLAEDPARGWIYKTIPCDVFLNTCNELICHSIEVELPLRGSLSMGTAILDETKRVFLGAPLIESHELERGQEFIGASFCPSITKQTIPARFKLPFTKHLKKGYEDKFGGFVLDWPRHWRNTRGSDAKSKIRNLSKDAQAYSTYYDNTTQLLDLSDQYKNKYETPEEVSIRTVYEAFSSPNLVATVKAVRAVRG
ncbi:MAG: hypothetical protein V1933_02355 [Candidatus Omnitrophota bacterium]